MPLDQAAAAATPCTAREPARRRVKCRDPHVTRRLLNQLYQGTGSGRMSIGQAVKTMRRVSRLTQPAFAAHRGISVHVLRQIERDQGGTRLDALNRIASIFSLQVGFVPR